MRLLIVEDNAAVRRMIRGIVAGVGMEIDECADGAQALAAYVAHHPDWVLMDIAMKDVDGIAATREIRAQDPAAKIIIVTSYDGADLREAAREAGARGYVLKENLLDVRLLLHTLEGTDETPLH